MTSGEAIALVWNEILWALDGVSYVIFYIEAHLSCIVILIFLVARQQSSSQHNDALWTYYHSLYVKIIFCVSSILRALVDVDIIPKSGASYFLLTAINMIIFGILCWLSFLFNATYQDAPIVKGKFRKFLTAVPLLICFVIILTSPFTGIFIRYGGHIIGQGDYYFVLSVIFLAYPLLSIVMTFFRRDFILHHEREMIMMTLMLPVLFLLCGILRYFEWKIPSLCYAIIISDVYIYLTYSDSLISIDPLTKIANKNGFMRHLSERFRTGKDLENLYLFALDVEGLNELNTQRGRNEGNKALIVIARGLKQFQEHEHECHVSRYYGDKFMIMADIAGDEDIELFSEHIRNYISNAVMAEKLDYMIYTNIGYAHYEAYSKTETINGLIEEANRTMNENKEQRKFQIMWRGSKSDNL